MSDLRRRFLMIDSGGGQQYDADSYIQEGLVFQLDGLEKGSNTGYWTDRKGGIKFELSSTYADVLTNAVHMKGAGIIRGDGVITPTFDAVDGTIEVVCTYQSGRKVVFVEAQAPNLSFGWNNNAVRIYGMATGTSQLPAWSGYGTGALVYSLTGTHAVSNITNNLTSGSNAGWSNSQGAGYIELGGRSYNSSDNYTGDIYAIRVYNTKLSVAEMQFNQRIDNVRFNLGIAT